MVLFLTWPDVAWNWTARPSPARQKRSLTRLASTRAVEIPSRSEMIIEGEILHPPHFATGLLEATEEMVDRMGLFAACTVVETCGKKMPVRVMNPSKQPQMLHQGQVAAICQAVKLTSVQEAVAEE